MAAKRTLLIDADIVAFKFAAKGQRKYAFGTSVDELEDVTPLVDEYLAELKADLKATDLIICLSAPSAEGWRKRILPSYKENRTEVIHPELLAPIKHYMEHAYPSYRKPELEADDIMGILSTHPTLVPGERIIVSEDKDMKTIPGLLYNPAKDSKPRRISEEEADYWHLYQTLVGDATDGYKGCPGIGPKKAEAILKGPFHSDSPWWAIVGAWMAKTGLTMSEAEADALVQAQVARICRSSDYDFKNKRVIPWTPPSSKKKPTASTVGTISSKAKPSTAVTRSAPKTAEK